MDGIKQFRLNPTLISCLKEGSVLCVASSSWKVQTKPEECQGGGLRMSIASKGNPASVILEPDGVFRGTPLVFIEELNQHLVGMIH